MTTVMFKNTQCETGLDLRSMNSSTNPMHSDDRAGAEQFRGKYPWEKREREGEGAERKGRKIGEWTRKHRPLVSSANTKVPSHMRLTIFASVSLASDSCRSLRRLSSLSLRARSMSLNLRKQQVSKAASQLPSTLPPLIPHCALNVFEPATATYVKNVHCRPCVITRQVHPVCRSQSYKPTSSIQAMLCREWT